MVNSGIVAAIHVLGMHCDPCGAVRWTVYGWSQVECSVLALKRTNSWILLHDNAPAHWLVLFKYFLAKNNVTKLEHPPYSSDLGPALYLFPRLKSALKG